MPTEHPGTPVVVTLSDLEPPAPCCQRAHEQGYRRGYQEGYRTAVWDIGRAVPLADGLWHQMEQFLYGTLRQWVWRGMHDPDPHHEDAPRLQLKKRVSRHG